MALNPCKNPDCENTVSDKLELGFCFTCMSSLHRDSIALEEELERVLSLEAQFVEWCHERGLPNPHD